MKTKISLAVIALFALMFIFSQVSYVKAEPKKAADFNLRDPWNNNFSLEQFKGKTIILNFFRIYCGGSIAPDTKKQIQELNKICQKYCQGENCTKGKVTIISITLATCPTTDLKEWANDFKINWFLGNDYDDYKLDIIQSYAVYLSKLKDPALIFINKNQEVFYTSNYMNYNEIVKKLEESHPELKKDKI